MGLVGQVAGVVAGLCAYRERVLVGIDGPDAAGKTTLADSLARRLRNTLPAGTGVLRASIDGFHRPREQRLARGELSAEGCYHDTFDHPALLEHCLLPFARGAAAIGTARHDHRADADRPESTAVPARAVLVFDGVFLLREQLRACWTLTVHLRVSPAETLRRALVRDRALFGSEAAVRRRYEARYLPAQQLYRDDADPEAAADVLIDNERPDVPVLLRLPAPPAHSHR
ncbi:uridylate kinase [Catellatospora citrea]|uniref:uridylate kinase n=1 Tax=Catellatospora citrea TaxID=53366 RepID=UPI0034111D7C